MSQMWTRIAYVQTLQALRLLSGQYKPFFRLDFALSSNQSLLSHFSLSPHFSLSSSSLFSLFFFCHSFLTRSSLIIFSSLRLFPCDLYIISIKVKEDQYLHMYTSY